MADDYGISNNGVELRPGRNQLGTQTRRTRGSEALSETTWVAGRGLERRQHAHGSGSREASLRSQHEGDTINH